MSDTSPKLPGDKKRDFHDKRKYPRIEHDCEVVLVLPGGQEIAVRMFDLSPDGMQVRFNRETASVIKPVVENIYKKTTGDLGVRFPLSVDTDEEIMHDAGCRPIYIHRIEDAVYAMGMQFTRLQNESRKILKKFIELSMEPL